MIGRIFKRKRVKQRSFGQTTLVFRYGSEPLQFLGADDAKIQAGLGAVVEEDETDNFTGSGGQAEVKVQDSEDCLDVRDLLLDESD